MRPIISIVGKSDSGKTSLLESLIIELKQRGYKLAVIKHSASGFEIDQEGTDTWRLNRAGSDMVAISSPSKLAVINRVERDFDPKELSRFVAWDCDLILTEGFKQSATFKIEIHRREQGRELVSPIKQLLAVVTDEPLDVDVPQFARDDVPKLADLIENNLQTQLKQDDIQLFVNDAFVPLNPFVRGLLSSILIAVLNNLKGIDVVKSLRITLRRRT